MATKTIITKVDDIDGSPADATFAFGWQGSKYHIDLSKAHAAEMKADFDKWVSAARRDRGGARVARAAAPAEAKPAAKPAPKAAPKPAEKKSHHAAKTAGPSAADVRAWAAAKGIKVADRGRLAPAIIAQFLADKAAN